MDYQGICPVCRAHTVHTGAEFLSAGHFIQEGDKTYPAIPCKHKHTTSEVREALGIDISELKSQLIDDSLCAGANTNQAW